MSNTFTTVGAPTKLFASPSHAPSQDKSAVVDLADADRRSLKRKQPDTDKLDADMPQQKRGSPSSAFPPITPASSNSALPPIPTSTEPIKSSAKERNSSASSISSISPLTAARMDASFYAHVGENQPIWFTPELKEAIWNPPTEIEGEEEGEVLPGPEWTLADRLGYELAMLDEWLKPRASERAMWDELKGKYFGLVKDAVDNANKTKADWKLDFNLLSPKSHLLRQRVIQSTKSAKTNPDILEPFDYPMLMWENVVVFASLSVPPDTPTQSIDLALMAISARLMDKDSQLRSSAIDIDVKRSKANLSKASLQPPLVLNFRDKFTKVKWEIRLCVGLHSSQSEASSLWVEDDSIQKYVVPLTRILKQLFYVRKLTSVLDTYAMYMWVVAFLRLHPLVYKSSVSGKLHPLHLLNKMFAFSRLILYYFY
jgi:hypothetical protein